MNRTLRGITTGALLIVLTACTQGAPTGATLPPLTTSAVASSSASTPASTTPETTSEPDVTSTTQAPPVDVTVPAEASALPLPTEQVDIPADNAQEEADRAAIEAVWRQVWDLYRDGYGMTAEQVSEVAAKLMVEPVRTLFTEGITSGRASKKSSLGTITTHPYWFRSVAGKQYAIMADCADFSSYSVVDEDSGESGSPGRANLNSVGYFVKDASGEWRLWQIANVDDVTCTAS